MRVLTSVLPTIQRIFPPGHVTFTAGLIAALIGIEILGRQATSDREDLLAVCTLVILFALIVFRHRKTPHPWMRGVQDVLQSWIDKIERLRNECGVDLRGSPYIPQRTPRWVRHTAFILLGVMGLGIAAWVVYPQGWREVGVKGSYVFYLLVLGFVWSTLICTLVGCIYVPMQTLCGPLRLQSEEDDSRSTEMIAFLAYFILVSVLAWMTSPLIPICMATIVVLLAWGVFFRKGGDQAAVLWQRAGSPRVYSIPLHRVLSGAVGLGGLLVLGVLTLACGGRLLTPPDPEASMLATSLLGAAVAWTIPGLLAVGGARLWALRRTDPALRTAPTVHISGLLTPAERARLKSIIRAWGWKAVLDPMPKTPEMVGIAIVPEEKSEATEFNPQWPLKVSLKDLESSTLKERLTRRDEIILRRFIFKGLTKLFQRVSHHRGTDGGGFLLAPQWWFIDGLTREESDHQRTDEDEPAGLKRVGPAFTSVWPARARQHLHSVLRRTQVDLIFVEDGVKPKSLEKVIRALLELYDVHAGRKKAEDYHFQGLNKVKVVIHDYEPGKLFDIGADYDEAKFNELTRLRILHIFKDKGGQEERVEPPADFSWEPQPLAFG